MKKYWATCAMVLMVALSSSVRAEDKVIVPHLLNLQSLIYDSDGNLSTSETVDLTIRILDEGNNVLFTEGQAGVPIINGAVNISIGSSQALPLEVLDPTTGQKFLDIGAGGESPFELMPLVAVPYAMWAEKALTVADDSIESRHIKNGSIKLEDLEDGIAFSDLTGQASDGQIPSSIATVAQLNAHLNSNSAHQASAIVVSSNFSNFVASTVLEALQKLDAKAAEEIVNRQQMIIDHAHLGLNAVDSTNIVNESITSADIENKTITGADIADKSITTDKLTDKDGNALPDFSGWDQDKTDDITTSGGTITGDLQVNGNIGVSGTVDGVDVSGLNGEVVAARGAYPDLNARISAGEGAPVVPANNTVSVEQLKTTLVASGDDINACTMPTSLDLERTCGDAPGMDLSTSLGHYFPVISIRSFANNINNDHRLDLKPEIRFVVEDNSGGSCIVVRLNWNRVDCIANGGSGQRVTYRIYKLLPN